MLAVIMKILSILGIVLLVLLCILAAILLMVLFIPIVYRLDAEKDDENVHAAFRLRWLFGMLRAGYSYPEPGRILVKVLWFTVFDSGTENADVQNTVSRREASSQKEKFSENPLPENNSENNSEKSPDREADENVSSRADSSGSVKKTLREKLFAKYEKIKYTIVNIYDKIKHILENLSFYKKLLQDEETRLLFSHTCGRIGKIMRHIRPRRIDADVIFGTGSPDITGYAYAVYGMLSPHLGKAVCVTPDFTQAVLEGSLHAAGHITVFTLLVNLLAVLLDRRLRLFIRRIRAHSDKMKAAAGSGTT